MADGKTHLGIVIVGHVDAGKSTTTGRLLFELGGIDERTMEKLTKEAEMEGKGSFAFAYFLDKSKEERKRGVTIACTTKEFFTEKYHYTVIDAPGHRDFIKNMVSGASQADVALLMVPANKGGFETAIQKGGAGAVKGQTRHHAELTKLLGINQIMVGVNKMDDSSCNYSEDRFKEIESNMRGMLKSTGWRKLYSDCPIIPLSGWLGDNISTKSDKMPWYKGFSHTRADKKVVTGHTLVDALNDYVEPPKRRSDNDKFPFRMPVSGVYTIKGVGSVITGRIEQGTIQSAKAAGVKGIEVAFWPVGVKGLAQTIEMHHKQVDSATHGDNVGISVKNLKKENMPKAGDVMAMVNDATCGPAASFTAELKVQDHPGELKPASKDGRGGYTPLVLCRTGKASCRMMKIDWKIPKKVLKKLKPKDIPNAKQPDALFVKAGDMACITFEPSGSQAICVDDFKTCEGLGRIAVLESNDLVMLGKIIKRTIKPLKLQ